MMIMSHFLEHMDLVIQMVFLVFSTGISLANATAKDESMAEISSREAVVKWAGYGEEKLSTGVISGQLLCPAASHDKLSSHHSYPVSVASVAVFCSTRGRTKKSWAKGCTGSYEEFLIDLPSHLHTIPNLEKICLVKVLHLPKNSPCRHAFTGKHKGIKLTSLGEGVRIYTTHDINLMPKPSQDQMRDGSKTEHTVSAM